MFGSNEKSNGKHRNGLGMPDPNGPLIDMRGVIKQYQTPAGPFTALKDINLQVDEGEFVAVIGKSGSGKSTLLNMIAGIDRPTEGEVYVQGVLVHMLNEGQLAEWRGRGIGIIFQFFQLLPTLTVAQNIMLPMEFAGLYMPRQRRARAIELLGMVELDDQADKMPAALSGGQQQRVAIARALANDPPLLVADEPTGNLDSRTAEAIFGLFEKLTDEGKSIVMVTHDGDLTHRVSRALTVADGRIVDEQRKPAAALTIPIESYSGPYIMERAPAHLDAQRAYETGKVV
jgi:putative ABC transport system ATP-binding protein